MYLLKSFVIKKNNNPVASSKLSERTHPHAQNECKVLTQIWICIIKLDINKSVLVKKGSLMSWVGVSLIGKILTCPASNSPSNLLLLLMMIRWWRMFLVFSVNIKDRKTSQFYTSRRISRNKCQMLIKHTNLWPPSNVFPSFFTTGNRRTCKEKPSRNLAISRCLFLNHGLRQCTVMHDAPETVALPRVCSDFFSTQWSCATHNYSCFCSLIQTSTTLTTSV